MPKNPATPQLLEVLLREKEAKSKGGIYHKLQVAFTYNSNHIEGSKLTEEQTRHIFETNTLGISESINVDDIIETSNHFRAIDDVIEKASAPVNENFIKSLHSTLKSGTSDSQKEWFAVGDYKKLPNEVGGNSTTAPEDVHSHLSALLTQYNSLSSPSFEGIAAFHHDFEQIHPFQDGNGRVGRLIILKEFLKHDIVPTLITDELKLFYYRGLAEWNQERGFLLDTLRAGQDAMKQSMDYFRIPYSD